MRRHAGLACLGLAVAFLLTGCGRYAFAPPIRTTQGGPPGALQPGHVAVGGAVGMYLNGGPTLAYAIDERVAFEAGAEAAGSTWALGWAGARLTPVDLTWGILRLAFDVEGGLGGGAGGVLSCGSNEDDDDAVDDSIRERCDRAGEPLDWWRRYALGGYAGMGLGFHVAWFAVFTRARVQLSTADNLPMTLWWTAAGGISFDILGWVSLYAAGGWFGLHGEGIQSQGPLAEGGLSISIPIAPRHRPSS